MSVSVTSIHLLHISVNNDSTTALGTCSCQNFVWKVWDLFLIANQNLHCCNRRGHFLFCCMLLGRWTPPGYSFFQVALESSRVSSNLLFTRLNTSSSLSCLSQDLCSTPFTSFIDTLIVKGKSAAHSGQNS